MSLEGFEASSKSHLLSTSDVDGNELGDNEQPIRFLDSKTERGLISFMFHQFCTCVSLHKSWEVIVHVLQLLPSHLLNFTLHVIFFLRSRLRVLLFSLFLIYWFISRILDYGVFKDD